MSNSPSHSQLKTRKFGRRIWQFIRSHLRLSSTPAIIPLALMAFESIAHSAFGLMGYLTNRFHVAARLFSNRSQVTSKCGKNKKVAHEAQPSVSLMFLPHFDVLCDLLLN